MLGGGPKYLRMMCGNCYVQATVTFLWQLKENYSGHIADTFGLLQETQMPWQECRKMDERLRFIARLLDGEGRSTWPQAKLSNSLLVCRGFDLVANRNVEAVGKFFVNWCG